jgi:cation:H+ antiporter
VKDVVVYLTFAVGLLLVIKGADWFVESAVWMARKTGMSEVLVGATIVSVGTTLPELSVSTYSSIVGTSQVALGNAIGSCIVNIGFILGISVAARALPVNGKAFDSRAILMLLAAVLATVLSADGSLSRIDGALLLAALAANIVFLIRSQRRAIDADDAESEHGTSKTEADPSPTSAEAHASNSQRIFPLNAIGQLAQFVIGALTVALGSRMLVSSATTIAERLGISEVVIGLTIVSMGTSLPELATAVTSLIKGHQSLSAGNIVGANLINLTAVLGVSALVNPIPISGSSLLLDYPVMLALMGILILFAATGRALTRWQGCILLAVYVAYSTALFMRG